MKISFLIYILFSISVLNLYSQSIVISEYYNVGGNADGEWTEFLIVQDNLNLVGYIYRDNSDAASWSGGIKFKDIPLWQNLRIGTILVIGHRSSGITEDLDPTDGYIEVKADDLSLFDRVTYNNPDWNASALSINQDNDILQVLDASGNDIHTLGHSGSTSSGPYTEFMALTGPKLMRKGSMNNNSSLRVVPGAFLSHYNQGYDASNTYTFTTLGGTKGFPNVSTSDLTSNSLYWRSLRQPVWNNPNQGVNISNLGKSIKIDWNPAENSVNNYEGYMILRIPYPSINLAEHPVDGGKYKKGDFLGSAEVIGFVTGFNSDTFTDIDFSKVTCGTPYVYRIYAYRYNPDHQGKDLMPETARGRNFNEDNYAQTIPVERPQPAKPEINTTDGKFEYCGSDPVTIKLKNTYSNDVSIQWYKDGNAITGATSSSVKVSENGQYYVIVKHQSSDCISISEAITITIYPAPIASLFIVVNGNLIPVTKDTTILVCKDPDPNYDYPRFNLQGSNIREWYFDDRLKTEELNKTEIIAAQKGTYFGVVKNGVCADTTPSVFITYIDYQITFSPSPMIFDADESPIQTLTIYNNSNTDLILNLSNFVLPPNFKLYNVTLPKIVKQKDSLKIEIEYIRTEPGNDKGKFRLLVLCSRAFSHDFQGFKGLPGTAGIVVSPDTLDFGKIPICELSNSNLELFVKSVGTISSKIYSPIGSPDIDFNPNSFPVVIEHDSTIKYSVRYNNTNPGFYSGTIRIPSESVEKNPKTDTTEVAWKIEIINPDLVFEKDNLISIATCTDTAFQEITLTNESGLPITITDNFSNTSIVSIQNLPIIIEPAEVKKIIVRAISGIDQSLSDKIILQPCKIEKDINFQIKKSNIKVDVKNNLINFGLIPLCPNSTNQELEAEIIVTGGSVTIKSVEYTGNFISNLVQNQIITGNHVFKIFPTGTIAGKSVGKIKVIFDQCEYFVEFNVEAERITPSISIKPNTIIDFGIVQPSINNTKDFTIQNTSPFPLELIVTFNNPNFKLNTSNLNPIILNANETKQIFIDYYTDLTGVKETGTYTILIKPCEIEFKNQIIAETSSNSINGEILINMPEKISGYIGETISLPLKFSTVGFNFNDADIKKVSYYFRYNGIQIYPNNAKSLSSVGWIQGSSVALIENSINSSILTIELANITQQKDNDWLDIELELLLLQSNIKLEKIFIDSLIFVSDGSISVKSDSSLIEILDNCELQDKSILFDNKDQIPKIVQKGNSLFVEFNTIIDGDISIKLVTVNGEILHDKKYNDVKHGTYSTQFDISNLQSGVYFLELRTPTGIFTQKILILK